MGLQRFFRSIYFRFCATTLVTVLVVILGYFLFSVYQTTFVLKTLENPEIHVLIGRLEQIYPLGVGALSILVFLMLAAMFDLVYFMENTKQYRSVTRTISAFARGDLAKRVQGQHHGPIGELALSFNKMADTIVTNLRELEGIDSLRRELIANVAHDLGGPVTSILGYLETILIRQGRLSKEDEIKYIEVALSNARFLSKLVGELSDLSKLDSREVTLRLERFSLATLLKDALARFSKEAETKKITLRTNVADGLPDIFGDVIMLERAFSNLIENAITFTPAGGSVELEARAGSNSKDLLVRITDTGPGIPEGDLPHIFDRFYRVDKDRSRTTGGSGLGLAIVKKILDAHGAYVAVDSLPSQRPGTSFEVTFSNTMG